MPSFKPPQQFNFREPRQGWTEWRSQFQRFRTASELTDKSGEVQVSSLIYSMGPEAEKIFTQFGLTDAEANDFQTVIGRFSQWLLWTKKKCYSRKSYLPQKKSERGRKCWRIHKTFVWAVRTCRLCGQRKYNSWPTCLRPAWPRTVWKTTIRKWADPYQGNPARQTKWAGEDSDKGTKGSGTFLSWCSEGRG